MPEFTLQSERRRGASLPLERLQLLQGARPIGPEQTRQSPVGKQLSSRLAASTVVRFVIGVADALDLVAAPATCLAKAAVHGHLRPKRGDLFWKSPFGLPLQALNPNIKRRPSCRI